MYTNLPPPLDRQIQTAVSLLGYIASLGLSRLSAMCKNKTKIQLIFLNKLNLRVFLYTNQQKIKRVKRVKRVSFVLDLVTQVCDVVLVKCIFSSGKPHGVRILE
jgi:hypothetical protein